MQSGRRRLWCDAVRLRVGARPRGALRVLPSRALLPSAVTRTHAPRALVRRRIVGLSLQGGGGFALSLMGGHGQRTVSDGGVALHRAAGHAGVLAGKLQRRLPRLWLQQMRVFAQRTLRLRRCCWNRHVGRAGRTICVVFTDGRARRTRPPVAVHGTRSQARPLQHGARTCCSYISEHFVCMRYRCRCATQCARARMHAHHMHHGLQPVERVL